MQAETLVETHSVLVEGVRHEQAKSDRTVQGHLQSEAKGFFEEITAETLSLNPLVHREPCQKHARNWKTGQSSQVLDLLDRHAVYADGGKTEVSGDALGRAVAVDRKVRARQQVLLRMPEGEALEVLNE